MAISYNPSITTNGLVLHLDAANSRSYPGSGTTWTDLSGNGNYGTLTNSPMYSFSNNGYFTFNGSSNYIDITSSSSITFSSGTSYSLSAWFNISAYPSKWSGIVTKSREQYWYGLWLNPTNQINWAVPTSIYGAYNLTGSIPTLGWHHLCGVYNSSNNTSYIYLDGTLSNSATTTPVSVGSGNLVIGFAKTTTEYFNGNVSVVSVYNRALSATEILQNFNALKGRYGL